MDRELNKAEVRPLDSYVVDDGWTNYNNTSIVDAARAGTTLNQSGFWEFNSKFPQGLTPSSELVHNFGSNFGVWVGPRGGYNFYGSLADILVKSGKGSKAGGAIDVADRTYVKHFTDMAIQWQKDYGVNYWKWDGFADKAQYGAFRAADGVPGYANRHMTGGYENMYHVTDLWEAWIDLMEAVRQSEQEDGIKNLWISLTCYVNPSPWYLQWANSVWIQCTHDQNDAGSSQSKMDRQITYRDAVYYDYLKNHEFQFPLSNIYNHDPVYGKEGTGMNRNTATDEQFKNYLYMLATRGTAFWELYFSDSMMTDGKYEVAGEFLAWAEENYHMLKNSKMFGDSPNTGTALGGSQNGTQNAYGFACFDGTDGIISFRNSATTAKSVTVPFDRTIGVPEDAGTLQYHMEHAYKLTSGTPTTGTLTYGQNITVTLQPDEVRILRVSKDGDTTAPAFTRAYSEGGSKVAVRFSEKVNPGTFKINGQTAQAEASADKRTIHLTAANGAMTNGSEAVITAENVTDLAGNALEENTISVVYHENNEVLNQTVVSAGEKTAAAAAQSIAGNSGFSVSANVYTSSAGSIVKQGSAYEIGIAEDGKAYFTLNGATAMSKTKVNDGKGYTITGVKEQNGILKIYVNGTLEGASYKAENQYYEVEQADITVGNPYFVGKVTAIVSDTALGYDAVKEKFTPETPVDPGTPSEEQNWALHKTVEAKWKSDDSNACTSSDRPASMAVDGTKNSSDNYCDFGDDNRAESSYLQVDLGAVRPISKINLYRYWNDSRTYKGTVIALSETADFTNPTIAYNSDAENFHGFGAGSDTTYAESSNGKNITLANTAHARYVRVYMHGGPGNTNHIVELEVIGKEESTVTGGADYSAVDAAIASAAAMAEENYESLADVRAAVDAVVRGKDASKQAEVDAMAAAIWNAIGASVEKKEVKDLTVELSTAIEDADKKDSNDYTPESWAAYQEVVERAKVLGNNATKKELKEILEALSSKLVPKSLEIKKQLDAEIAEAEKKNSSDYTPESWAAYLNAVEAAKKLGADASAEELRAALDALQNTLVTVKQSLQEQIAAEIAAAGKLDGSVYTAESWKKYQDALTAAKALGGNAARAEYEQALKALRDAKNALVKKEQPIDDTTVEDGKVYKNGNYSYKIISTKKRTVEVKKLEKKTLKKLTIPSAVTFDKKSYKVVGISASAFKGNKKISSVIIGKNVTSIGKNAFAKCKSLKKITFKGKKLKKVGKNAFKGIHKKAVIRVPAAKLKSYKKILAKKGQAKSVKIKK